MGERVIPPRFNVHEEYVSTIYVNPYRFATGGGGGNGLLNNLIGYWKMDEASGNLIDAHTGGYDFTETGTISATTGIINNGRDFTGSTGNYFSNADGIAVTGASAQSLSFWMNSDNNSDVKMISFGGSGNGQVINLTPESSNTSIRWRHNGGNITYTGGTSTGANAHIVFTIPSGATTTNDALVYINGSLATASRTGGSDQTINIQSSDIYLGRRYDANSGYYSGLLDEIGYWGKGLSSTDVSTIYNSGSCLPFGSYST